MTSEREQINPAVCPLCGQQNHCMSHARDSSTTHCWCHNEAVEFPQGLLQQVPAEARRKACICARCAAKYSQQQ